MLTCGVFMYLYLQVCRNHSTMNEGTKLNFIRVRLFSPSLPPSLPPSFPSLPTLTHSPSLPSSLPPSLPPSLFQEIGMVHMRVAEGLSSRTQL